MRVVQIFYSKMGENVSIFRERWWDEDQISEVSLLYVDLRLSQGDDRRWLITGQKTERSPLKGNSGLLAHQYILVSSCLFCNVVRCFVLVLYTDPRKCIYIGTENSLYQEVWRLRFGDGLEWVRKCKQMGKLWIGDWFIDNCFIRWRLPAIRLLIWIQY